MLTFLFGLQDKVGTSLLTEERMAEMDSFDVNVKDFQGGSVVIKVYPTWNVSTVKQEIASRTNVNPQDFRIVFAGQTLSDTQTLWVS